MASQDLPPVPYQVPMTDDKGIASPVWSDWFKKVFSRVGGNLAKSDAWTLNSGLTGYQNLPSGLIIQWGRTSSIASGTNTTITLPVAYQNTTLQVVAGIRDNTAGVTTTTGHFGTGNYTNASFDMLNRTSAAYAFNWFSVGY